MTNVPAQYQSYVNNAAAALGIPASVVAAQIGLESGFNPNAKSGAGAEGIAQFIPGTFRAYGHGSPYNVDDAFAAYVNYMKSLLGDFHGNLKNALAAYNAGPGNIGAGMGYANKILSAAGTGNVTISDTGGGSGGGEPSSGDAWSAQALGQFGNVISGFNDSGNPFSSIGDVAQAIGAIATDVSTGVKMFSVLLKPAFWLRVGAFFVGIVFLSMGSVSLYGSIKK
jgi:hypothetical protein